MRLFCTILLVCALLTGTAFAALPALFADSGAKGAVLIECETGRVLSACDETERLPIASTTKIMTALLVLEHGDLDTEFTVDADAIRVEGSSMGLQKGDTVTLRALLWGMLLASGNDAANAAAVRVAGSVESFVDAMNARAAALGLSETRFSSPSGLETGEHYSTALDLARLTCFALQNGEFAEIAAAKSGTVSFGNPPAPRTLYNHNRLLRLDDDVIGVKTGYTKAAGRCLVSAARRDGLTLVLVTLGCPDDFSLHRRVYDEAFSRLHFVDFTDRAALPMPVTGGEKTSVLLRPAEPLGAWLDEEECCRVRLAFSAEPFCYAPIRKGERLGKAALLLDALPLAETALVADADVTELYGDNRSIIRRIRDFFDTPQQRDDPFFALR